MWRTGEGTLQLRQDGAFVFGVLDDEGLTAGRSDGESLRAWLERPGVAGERLDWRLSPGGGSFEGLGGSSNRRVARELPEESPRLDVRAFEAVLGRAPEEARAWVEAQGERPRHAEALAFGWDPANPWAGYRSLTLECGLLGGALVLGLTADDAGGAGAVRGLVIDGTGAQGSLTGRLVDGELRASFAVSRGPDDPPWLGHLELRFAEDGPGVTGRVLEGPCPDPLSAEVAAAEFLQAPDAGLGAPTAGSLTSFRPWHVKERDEVCG